MELTLFVIVGAIAVISAAMMLISENAIYSALFLILNFACIAFFFLMLNAPFLAMVQITVYAGAIMVLFLFVIMLLGAERVTSASVDLWQGRLTIPVAIAFALVFLVIASAAIIDSDIDHIEAEKIDPHIRVVHAFSEAPNVDVYLDDELIAANVSYKSNTDFEVWEQTGLQTVSMFEAGIDPASGRPLAAQTVEINEGEAISFVVIASDSADAVAGLAVATEKVAFNDEQGTSRVIAINALHKWDFVDVLNTSDGNAVLVDNLAYGIPSAGFLLDKGDHSIGVYADGKDIAIANWKDQEFDDNKSLLWVITEERQSGNAFESVLLNFEVDGSPSFGSPTHVGRLLFTRYVLPFEMVSLLLLVAMIGAIVLTHETLAVRRQPVRQLANPPAGLEQPIIGEPNK